MTKKIENVQAPSVLTPEQIDKLRFREFVASEFKRSGFQLTPFHLKLADWFEESGRSGPMRRRRLLMCYRNSGKSLMMCLYVCFLLLKDPRFTVLIISESKEEASARAAHIRKLLENHPWLQHLVPTNKRAQKWSGGTFNVAGANTGELIYSVSVVSVGSNQTGKHSDLIIADDLETSANMETPERARKVHRSLGEMASISDFHLYIGTPHVENSIYNGMQEDETFNILKLPVLNEFGDPQCPERHDETWIETQRTSFGVTEGIWRSQYLLESVSAAETLFSWDLIEKTDAVLERGAVIMTRTDPRFGTVPFWIGSDEILQLRAYLDPATGLKRRDKAVLRIVGLGQSGKVYLIHIEVLPAIDQLTGWEKLCAKAMQVLADHYCNRVTLETNAIGISLASDLRKAAAMMRGVRIIIDEMTRGPVSSKEMFIASHLDPLMRAGRLVALKQIESTEFKTELLRFPRAGRDDHIDSAAGAISKLRLNHHIEGKGMGMLRPDGFRPVMTSTTAIKSIH